MEVGRGKRRGREGGREGQREREGGKEGEPTVTGRGERGGEMQKPPSVRGYKDVTPLNLMSYVSCWIRVRTVVNSIASYIESSFPCGASDLNLLHQNRV